MSARAASSSMARSAGSAAALSLLAFLSVLAPAAGAGGPSGELEADAPVLADGRVDTLLPSGLASLVSSTGSDTLALRIQADRLSFAHHEQTASVCSFPFGPACAAGTGPSSTLDEGTLHEAEATLVRTLGAWKVVATTDRAYADTPSFGAAGELVATTAATTLLGSNPEPRQLSPHDEDWGPARQRGDGEVRYDADALSGQVAATGAILRAEGGFEALLQGLEVRLTGTTEDGEAFDRTFRLPAPGDGDAVRFLVLEADGELEATGSAPFTGFAPPDQRPVTDVRNRASFSAATGAVEKDGAAREHQGEDVALEGPLSLTLVRVVAGADGSPPRVAFSVAEGLALADVVREEREPSETMQLVAAGVAGAGSAAALLGAAFYWPRLKLAATGLLLPLYSRIERQSVLDHEKRDEIYELIRSSPGIHAHEIGERAQIGWGTTVYHLKLLESHALVVSKKSGRYKRFFVNTGEYTKKKDAYGALRNPTAKAVAQFIVDHPGTSQKELCAALGIQPSLASWHVEKLEGVDLVKRVKDGRQVRYFAGPAWGDLNVRILPGGGAEGVAET